MRPLLLVYLLLGLLGCHAEQDAAPPGGAPAKAKLPKVTLALNWYPEAEHGGFYAALVNGYYKEAGLDVEIIPGGVGLPVVPRVATRKVTFGVANADRVLVGRAQQADVVAVFAPLQMSPRCIMVHERSGIRKFADLKNMTLALSNTATFANYLRKKVPLEGVRIVPYGGNVSRFLLEDDFAQQGYVFSEPFNARKKGGDPHQLMVSELGYNPYTSLLVTSAENVEEHPALVRKMVVATRRGWRTYLEDSSETNEYIHSINEEMDLDILAFGAETIKGLCITEETPLDALGRMTLNRWTALSEQLVEAEAVDAGVLEPADAFTTKFLESSE
ncbi:MAG: myristoyl transferase [Planctomycetaceae bacterium]|nr:myristoyl transferase [Planctomycetaceae bacterium]